MAAPLADGGRLTNILGGGNDDTRAVAHWAVAVVSALVRSYTRLTITPVSGAELVLTGTPGRRLIVGERPLRAVSSVTLDGTLLDVGEYSVLRAGALIRRAGWGSADVEVKVVCDYGFDAVPADLGAVVETAAARLTANPVGWRTMPAEGPDQGEGQLVAAFPAGFTVSELSVLNRYRRRCG